MIKIYRIILPEEIYEKQEFAVENILTHNIKVNEVAFINTTADNLDVDTDFHKSKYGFELSKNEINEFITHREIWKDFISHDERFCLIVESNVELKVTADDLLDTVNELNENEWDIFFPYSIEELNGIPDNAANNFQPYAMGYKWGNSIYMLNRQGAEKLLKINTIKDRVDNEIISLTLANKLHTFYSPVDWLDISRIDLKEWPDRIECIWNEVNNLALWTVSRKQKIKCILQLLSDICYEHEIPVILYSGSHLGYIRHGGIMSWDDDVDIGIEEKYVKILLEELKKYPEYKSGERIWNKNCIYYKIWRNDGETIENFDHTFPFVDIWIYNKKGNNIIFKDGAIFPNSAKKDFVDVMFEGVKYGIPYNSIEVLDNLFPDWRTKIRVYPWCHRLEKRAFPLLTVPVQVNINGRMISIVK